MANVERRLAAERQEAPRLPPNAPANGFIARLARSFGVFKFSLRVPASQIGGNAQ